MKNYRFLSFILLLSAVSSCNLNDNSTTPPYTQFAFVQVSPDAPNVDVYADGNLLVSGFPYTSDTGYFSLSPGTLNIKVAATGTTNYVLDTGFNLAPAAAYSIYTIDSFSHIKGVAVIDNFSVPPADSVRLRFFHFSPDVAAVDLGVTGIATPLYSNRIFNDESANTSYQQFITVPAGGYNLEVRNAGTSDVITSAPGAVFQGGKVYSIYLKGFAGGTGAQALGIGNVIQNE